MRLKIRIGQWSWAKTYSTWNPADKWTWITLSWGDLTATSGAAWTSVRSTVSKSSWKWYWETKFQSGSEMITGIGNSSAWLNTYLGFDANWWGYMYTNKKINNNTQTAYWATYTTGDIIWVALDVWWWTIEFYKNNVSQWVAYTGLTGTLFAMAWLNWSGQTIANFGATALTYTPPAWYNAWLYN